MRIAWVELSIWIFYVQENVCADWTLNSLLYLCLVLRCSLIVLSVDYTCVLWNWLWKNNFSANFPQVLDFQCEVCGRTYSYVQNESSLAICWPSNCSSGQDLYRFKTWFSFSAIHTSLHFYWFIMASCVFFSWISPEILAFCAHLFSSHDIHCVFRYSNKSLCF
jgi:hypothetical protein